MTRRVPTVPTDPDRSVQQIRVLYQQCTDRTNCTDRNVEGSGLENTLADLLKHIEAATAAEPAAARPLQPDDLFPADIYELEAMRQHYAARAGPEAPPCTMKAGLLKGFWAHRHISPTNRKTEP